MSSLQVPQTGSIFAGRYRVEGVLGAGGMGVVLRATQLEHGRPVALKVLTAEAAVVGEAVARFRQEARIASRIRNVHVVSVLDFGDAEDGRHFIAMELLEGIDLASLVEERGPLPIEEAVALVLQGCAGVAAAHAQGLVHRDLKPANLFLARRDGLPPVVKVLDFGLSKSLDGQSVHLTQTAMAMGTPMYMAPEQVMSTKHVDARCDQHAMGMVLFELCTGRPPYDLPSPTALAVAIATHPPPSARALRPEIPVELDRAIQRALAKRPEDRFEDLGRLAQAIVVHGPSGSRPFARMIEATLAPLSEPDMEAVPTVQISLPDSLLPDRKVTRSGRMRVLTPPAADGDVTPALPQPAPALRAPTSPDRAAVTVTASPVSTDPRGRAIASAPRASNRVLLGIALAGIVTVSGITLAMVTRSSGSDDAPAVSSVESTPTTAKPTVEVAPRTPMAPTPPPVVTADPSTSASVSARGEPSAKPAKKPKTPSGPHKPAGPKSDPLLKYD